MAPRPTARQIRPTRWRALERSLAAAQPGRRVEVFNVAVTAINSHVVREIAAEVEALEPDVVVLYLGNNEVVGPFGAGSPLSGGLGSLPLIRGVVRLRGTRVGRLLARVGHALAPRPTGAWRGMETFAEHRLAWDDPRLARIHDHFRGNLRAIVAGLRAAGAAVVLCTVPTNLSASPPFASGDDGAQALYERGRALWEAGDPDAAWRAFSEARDRDQSRFRADSAINRIIREEAAHAATLAGPEAQLVDLDASFQRATRQTKPGGFHALLWEHVHLRFEGTHLVARALAAALLPAEARSAVPGIRELAQALVYTGWSELEAARAITALMQRPPFTGQSGAAERTARIARYVENLKRRLTSDRGTAIEANYAGALQLRPEDTLLRARYGDFLLHGRHDPKLAIPQLERVVAAWPEQQEPANHLAEALSQVGRHAEGLEVARRAFKASLGSAQAHGNLGVALARAGELDEAEAAFRRAIAVDPSHARSHFHLAQTLALRERLRAAKAALARALALSPHMPEARALEQRLDRP